MRKQLKGRMTCPKCGEPIYGKVKDVFHNYGGMVRKRECEKCGVRFMTSEKFICYVNTPGAGKRG